MRILSATWEKLFFLSFADLNTHSEISLWFPRITSKFSQLAEECVAIFCDSDSWAKGHPGLEALRFCDGCFLQLMSSKSMKVWLCHHSCTGIYSISCFHSKRHEGLLLQVITNTLEYLKKCFYCISTLVLLISLLLSRDCCLLSSTGHSLCRDSLNGYKQSIFYLNRHSLIVLWYQAVKN